MERKEPTLSGGVASEPRVEPRIESRDDTASRRTRPSFEEHRSVYVPPSSSSLPGIALAVALIAVAGGGFLGWQLMNAQDMLVRDAARITQLEGQLNMTSTESTQSVTALQINLKSVDADVKKLWDVTRKTNSDMTEKFSGLNKNLEAHKTELTLVKGDVNTLKQDSLAHKATLDELTPRIDTLEKSIAEQRKKSQDLSANLSAMAGQVKATEGLASRITSAEEAIDAIDDNRRNINKDLLQIKQQLGIKN